MSEAGPNYVNQDPDLKPVPRVDIHRLRRQDDYLAYRARGILITLYDLDELPKHHRPQVAALKAEIQANEAAIMRLSNAE